MKSSWLVAMRMNTRPKSREQEEAMPSYEESPQDEGYSEDPLTAGPSSSPLPSWIMGMTAKERTEYVMNIIAHLPTAQVADIVSRLRPRLYINFFDHLPNEVLLHILSYLDPESLINTARASREWMSLALDWRLWEQLYILEGFRAISSEVEKFEKALNAESIQNTDGGHRSKRRATPQCILPGLGDGDSEMVDVDIIERQPSIFGAMIRKQQVQSRSQDDVSMSSPASYLHMIQPVTRPVNQRPNRRMSTKPNPSLTSGVVSATSSLISLDRRGASIQKRLNWQYLYAQRRRLESNWESAKYVNFQLPDPYHPEEAHEECIYTIQLSGKNLVSGSRDRTVRIWDLDARRLVRPPLRGHSGSVLCLQFDADLEEDLIVSGSSDSSIILWKFSTGQIIQRLRKAHRESVLNVRFDKRVLVTCSKDKTIKIFNRTPLHAGDVGYPTESQAVNPVPIFLDNYGFHSAPMVSLPVKQPYSIIGCLEGHGAAVNAVQIHGDEIVSASGDRLVKVWNWVNQTCVRTLIGHTKGIACVQYDGRRIVSGSSDNEVKVFDKETGLEVASLRAHTNLVRTVQAGFGDLPHSVEEDKADARAIDNEYFKAVGSGSISRDFQLERGRPRNAGSRKPEDITAYGAKLPPGGGGGRFGRIVSGSYDETIIIWRRDKEGVWKAQHILRQEDGAQAAASNFNFGLTSSRAGDEITSSQTLVHSSLPSQQTPYQHSGRTHNVEPPGTTDHDSLFYRNLIVNSVAQGPAALRQAITAHPMILNRNEFLSEQIARHDPDTQHLMNIVVAAARTSHQYSQLQPSHLDTNDAATPDPMSVTAILQATPPTPETTLAPMMGITPTILAAQAANIQGPLPSIPGHHHLTTNMARIFKLQFDARRIICCSQTNIIVGWDFANNDQKIIEASRFFAPIE